MKKEHFKKMPIEIAEIELDGEKHMVEWIANTSPTMLAVIASLASLNDPKIVDIFNEFGVYLKDINGKQIWPKE